VVGEEIEPELEGTIVCEEPELEMALVDGELELDGLVMAGESISGLIFIMK